MQSILARSTKLSKFLWKVDYKYVVVYVYSLYNILAYEYLRV